jgi:hypothetical protein
LPTSIVLSNRSVPPQIRAPLSSTNADFDRRCPYGPPCLLEDAHQCLLLLQPQAGAPRAMSWHISMVLSNISVTPQRRAPMSSKNADFDKRCPSGLPCLLGEAYHSLLLLQHQAEAPPSFELAHLHGLILQICLTSKQGTSGL